MTVQATTVRFLGVGRGVDPRVRGGYTEFAAAVFIGWGRSAYAEGTLCVRPCSQQGRVDPHVRGELFASSAWPGMLLGRSARTRRALPPTRIQIPPTGSIRAYAEGTN